jgi:predicted nucleic acid-binding protein
MILVDTSVWVDHLRAGDEDLSTLLNNSQVLMHPFVLGELACGNLRNREMVLRLLKDLPHAALATDDEVLFFIERHALMGRGIG